MNKIYFLIPIALLLLLLAIGCVSQQATSTNVTQQQTTPSQETQITAEEMAYQALVEELNKLETNTSSVEQQLLG
jgi:septal ring factor EnvC (AmiA/AmiB activator)